MPKLNVAVTGYYGTGSSAVTDLLREYKKTSVVPFSDKNYEHTVFYVSGGLFDLCTLLTHGNSPFTSDMVMNNFIDAMDRLNKYDFVWFGSYRKLFGNRFKEIVDQLVSELGESKKGENSNHITKSSYSIVKTVLQLAAHLIYKRNFVQYGCKYHYDGKNVFFAMPSEKEVFEAARRFTEAYFNMFDTEDVSIRIFDHLIWPHQIDEYSRCFTDDFKTIVVDRDPRDVYLLNKYVWFKPPVGHGTPHFPIEPEKFVEEWTKTIVQSYSNKNTLRIHYEDLIYSYESTVMRIEEFLSLNETDHVHKGEKLDISKSIENTQVFKVSKDWEKEVEYIAEKLDSYLYAFPYERKPDVGNMFDDPRTISAKRK